MMNNDFVNVFAKVASEKMEDLKASFNAELEKILMEMADNVNKAESAKDEAVACPCEKTEPCERCAYDESDEYQTVTLGDDEFFEDDAPCEIITICVKKTDKGGLVSIEYDKEMGPNGAMATFLNAFPHMMKHSMEHSGIEVSFDDCLSAVSKGFVEMSMDAALKF